MTDHFCTKEREIDELKKEFENIKSLQFTDHDLLIRIETKFDVMSDNIKTVSNKLDMLATQPSNRFEKLKMVAYASIITGVLTIFLQRFISSL
jgi:hypothetical protein